jgi:KDO2-lipid IV(A) lauroyltransferase
MSTNDRPSTTDRSLADHWGNAAGLLFMRLLARLPLSWVRALGWVFGQVLHGVAARRRRIARTNWALCFPDQTPQQARAAVRRHFVYFAQAWLDRSWLWHADPETVSRRLQFRGDPALLQGDRPTVMFVPHFVGMDAGWTALTLKIPRRFCGMYADQLNPAVNRWILAGRHRFGEPHIVARRQGLKPLVAALKAAEPLYLLPDMDYGPDDSVFVPFYGIAAATIPSLSRFARLARAQVLPVISRLTPSGYEVSVLPVWSDFPTDDPVADTARMNRELQDLIATMPEQYFWVHKRFKNRPPGEPDLYGGD